jgi:negative regulator of flagellin synthesis FlgM
MMKISTPPDLLIAGGTAAQAPSAKAAPAPAGSASSDAAKSTQSAGVAVTVSNLARSMELASRSDSGDVDTAKVNAMRAAIAQGTYVVNPGAIADKLLANAQEILNRRRN